MRTEETKTTPESGLTMAQAMEQITADLDYETTFKICEKMVCTLDNFVQLIELLHGDNDHMVLLAIVGFRKLMSLVKNPPTQMIIDANLLPSIMGLLSRQDIPRVQFEALWTLTNVASGREEYVQALLDKGAVSLFLEVIKVDGNTQQVKEQAIWALGNIAGDENFFRNQILKAGAIQPVIMAIVQGEKDSAYLRNCVWCLANLIRGKPLPSDDDVQAAIPVAAQILAECTMDEILTDAMWCLSYISDAGQRTVVPIMESGITPRVIELITHENSSISIPALRAIGNFVTGPDEQTNQVLRDGGLAALETTLDHPEQMMRKEVVWTISNICAGSETQVKSIIDLGIVDKLVQMAFGDVIEVQKEAVWALSNCTALKLGDVARVLVEKDVIRALASWLTKTDSKTLIVILEGLTNILYVGKSVLNTEEFSLKVEECGALDHLENLQEYPNQHVYELTVALLENYFQLEEVDLGNSEQIGALNFT